MKNPPSNQLLKPSSDDILWNFLGLFCCLFVVDKVCCVCVTFFLMPPFCTDAETLVSPPPIAPIDQNAMQPWETLSFKCLVYSGKKKKSYQLVTRLLLLISLHAHVTAGHSGMLSGIVGDAGSHYLDYKSTRYSERKWVPPKKVNYSTSSPNSSWNVLNILD